MWKIFFKYSDNSILTLTGKSKEISERMIEMYYRNYGRNAASAIYQKYPKKDYPARDFVAMYQSLHMDPCPICGTKSCLIQYISPEGKASHHVCCGRPRKEWIYANCLQDMRTKKLEKQNGLIVRWMPSITGIIGQEKQKGGINDGLSGSDRSFSG